MAKSAAILGVHLDGAAGGARVGALSRDQDGAIAFVVGEDYLRDPNRPILSLSWTVPGDDVRTRSRLADRTGKIGLNGYLPPWFAGLLPEGALRQLVIQEMGPGDHDQFDLLARLGRDLPGAVITPLETEAAASFGPLRLAAAGDFKAIEPDGVVKFSLAGVQLKFTAGLSGDRLTAPAHAGDGRCIIKAPTDRYPGLPQAEHAAMTLARLAGVNAAETRLVDVDHIDGIPREFFEHGEHALAVTRFDRTPEGGRIHMEDAGQIIGAVGERKYTMANTETILNMIRRFSTDWRADVLEGVRRIVVDVLIGNGDNHLKNWSFIFPAPGEVRLSPAYDIVPTVLYAPRDDLALQFAGTRRFANVTLKRFRRVAEFLGLDPAWIEAEICDQVRRAARRWPDALNTLLPAPQAETLIRRLDSLALVKEAQAGA